MAKEVSMCTVISLTVLENIFLQKLGLNFLFYVFSSNSNNGPR